MRIHRWVGATFGALCLASLTSCGDSATTGGTGSGGSPGTGAASSTTSSNVASASASSSSATAASTTTGAGGATPALVFGASASSLYRLDPIAKTVVSVAPFNGCLGIQDIAIDANGNMVAVSATELFSVDPTSAACTLVGSANQMPKSLSFVPAGTVDPNAEALVGYVTNGAQSQYVRVDLQGGGIINIGQPWNGPLVASGDIVSSANGPTYVSVTGAACVTGDCFVEVNPQTGAITKNWGEIAGYQGVTGLAYWAGSAYGFTAQGDVFEIQPQGATLVTAPLSAPPGVVFSAGGSTTSAP